MMISVLVLDVVGEPAVEILRNKRRKSRPTEDEARLEETEALWKNLLTLVVASDREPLARLSLVERRSSGAASS